VKKLSTAQRRKLLKEMPICKACMECKATRRPVRKVSQPRAAMPLQLFLVDYSARITPVGITGAEYYLAVLDDASGYLFVQPTKSRSTTATDFKLCLRGVLELLKRSGRQPTIEAVKGDHAKEFASGEFLSVCSELGILFPKLGAPYHKNSISRLDRAMRTVQTMAGAMVSHATASNKEWPFALSYAVFLYNRLPSKSRGGASPYECLFGGGRVPSTDCFRTWYAPVFAVKVGNDARRSAKFSGAAIQGYFLGYRERELGCLLRTPGRQKPELRHDVYFIEDLQRGQHLKPKAADTTVRFTPSSIPPIAPSAGDEPHVEVTRTHIDLTEDSPSPPPASPSLLKRARQVQAELTAAIDATPSPPARTVRERIPRVSMNLGAGGQEMSQAFLFQQAVREEKQQALLAAASVFVPRNYKEAMSCPDRAKWQAAREKEFLQMEQKGVWEEIIKPNKPIRYLGLTEVYVPKADADGNLSKYKCRICAQGFTQIAGKDYHNTTAPVVRSLTLRIVLVLVVVLNLETKQFDFSGAFLNSNLDVELYVRYPPGYPRKISNGVLRLRKALYGCVQSPHLWYKDLCKALKDLGYLCSKSDPCLFYKEYRRGRLAIIVIHVDDGIAAAVDAPIIATDITKLNRRYALESQPLTWYLGLRVDRSEHGMRITASAYIDSLGKRFSVTAIYGQPPADPHVQFRSRQPDEHKANVKKYQEIVGCLMFVANACRPDISYITSKLAQYLSDPSRTHMTAATRTVQYLLGTKYKGLAFTDSPGTLDPTGQIHEASASQLAPTVPDQQRIAALSRLYFFDSDYARCLTTSLSHTGILGYLHGNLMVYSSRKQRRVAHSTFGAETIAGCECLKITLAVDNILSEISAHGAGAVQYTPSQVRQATSLDVEPFSIRNPSHLRGDNASSIKTFISGNYFNRRSVHMRIRYQAVHQAVVGKYIHVAHVPTDQNPSDALTKALKPQIFRSFESYLVAGEGKSHK